VTIAQAQAEMNTLARRVNDQLAVTERIQGITVVPLNLYVIRSAVAPGIVAALGPLPAREME